MPALIHGGLLMLLVVTAFVTPLAAPSRSDQTPEDGLPEIITSASPLLADFPTCESLGRLDGGMALYSSRPDIKRPLDLVLKPAKIVLNYAHNCCARAQFRNCQSALENGADVCLAFNQSAIGEAFLAQHHQVFSEKRGAGLWVWKPYIIAKSLCNIHAHSVILYSDSASYFLQPLGTSLFQLVDELGQDMVPFSADTRMERVYTRSDVFFALDARHPSVTDSPQYLAGFSVWRNSPRAQSLAHQWLSWSTLYPLVADTTHNFLARDNLAGFREHTHDQSVFSVLAKKHGFIAAIDPTGQYQIPALWPANVVNRSVVINLHRDRR